MSQITSSSSLGLIEYLPDKIVSTSSIFAMIEYYHSKVVHVSSSLVMVEYSLVNETDNNLPGYFFTEASTLDNLHGYFSAQLLSESGNLPGFFTTSPRPPSQYKYGPRIQSV